MRSCFSYLFAAFANGIRDLLRSDAGSGNRSRSEGRPGCLSRLVALPTRTFAESVALLNRFFLAMLLTSRLSLAVTILSHCTREPVARSVHGVRGPQSPTRVENQMFRPEPRERELSVH